MSGLPEPLVPPDCDLRDKLPPMPFDAADLTGGGDYRWRFADASVTVARLRLMAFSWVNNPTGSLHGEMKSQTFARITLLTTRTWNKIADEVLSEWVTCSDGRRYHPFLCAEALKIHRKRKAVAPAEVGRLEISQAEWLAVRRRVFQRDGYVCQYCDVGVDAPQCDHFVPVVAGGLSTPDNLVTSCFPCNSAKRARAAEDFLRDDPDRLNRLRGLLYGASLRLTSDGGAA